MDYRFRFEIYPPPERPLRDLGGRNPDEERAKERNYPWPNPVLVESRRNQAPITAASSGCEEGGATAEGWQDPESGDEDWGVVPPEWR